ncbi:MAG: hypothetical protein K2J10_07365 [Muribaculaceae bacterium]|nr:hypothetical protein [Muribaculaceae bacterium]
MESGYFFCISFIGGRALVTAKPMYADDLWWDIWETPENKKEPLSLRGLGVFSLSGQVLVKYDIPTRMEDLEEILSAYKNIFDDAESEISKFIEAFPDADKFYPDVNKIDSFDRDKLLYLITLIHNGRFSEVLSFIKEARRNKHHCMFNSGFLANRDDYDYIRSWCKKHLFIERVKRNAIGNRLMKYYLFRKPIENIGIFIFLLVELLVTIIFIVHVGIK